MPGNRDVQLGVVKLIAWLGMLLAEMRKVNEVQKFHVRVNKLIFIMESI